MKLQRFPGAGYGLALVFVVVACWLSLLLRGPLPDGFLIFFLCAVMLAGWFGRTGPGLFAVLLSTVAASYYFIPPYPELAVDLDKLPYFFTFLLSALLTSWLGSARRSAEERQKAHLDELFEQTPDAILLVDLEDRVLRLNTEFTRIFQFTAEESMGRRSGDLIVPSEFKAEVQRSRDQLANGQNTNIETIRMRKDGSRLDVSEVSFPVVADGRCIAYYLVFRDMTTEKRAAQRLQKAQTDLAHLSRITTVGEIASSIAHEINQPIGAIVTNGNAAVRWLAQQPPNMVRVEESVTRMVRDANRASQVIGRIRSLLAKNLPAMVCLDINEVIREVLVLISNETSRRGVTVKSELEHKLPTIVGDPVQLQQVLLNLVMNSLEALSTVSDRPRQFWIRSSRKTDCVQVQVEDSGNGFAADQVTEIFDAFFTTKKDGLGMGLTISRSIIESHGGSLWADRGHPSGAILNFTIPAETGVE